MPFPNADLRETCHHFLSGHLARTQRAWLEYLAASPAADLSIDRYGDGPAIALLEREVAGLLDKEAALFIHKGVVAQQMALRVWKTRLGGNLFTVFPYVLAALEGLHHHLPKMEAYVARAREVSAALAEIPGVMIVPDPPQTNAFQIYLPAGCEGLRKAAEKLAETEHIWLFGAFEETHFPPLTMAEITIGDAAEQWTTEEIVAAMKTLLTYAQKNTHAQEIS